MTTIFEEVLSVAEIDTDPLWVYPPYPFPHIRRGVLYFRVPEDALKAFIYQPNVKILAARAVVGPALFFARRDGPIIPYDINAKDQNLGIHVRARPWPYCFGDVLWVICEWLAQPVVVLIDRNDGIEFFVGTPNLLATLVDGFASWSDPQATDIVEEFRTGRPPPFKRKMELDYRGRWRRVRRRKKKAGGG